MLADVATTTLDTFLDDLQALQETCSDQQLLADAVSRRLRHQLCIPNWLPPEYQVPCDERYRQHVLYVAPNGGLSVVALVWKPGQQTAIHDHVAWCVVGVYRGIERETRYELFRDATGRFLVQSDEHLALPGEVMVLVPPEEDIHRVGCAGHSVAVSIHIYGADIGRLGSSINHRFDDLPIRSCAAAAPSESWRTSVQTA